MEGERGADLGIEIGVSVEVDHRKGLSLQLLQKRPGALVLLDDYAYYGYFSQKLAMDQFAQEKGINILSLPTGQGLVLKPLVAR